jgi:hypothetical protein
MSSGPGGADEPADLSVFMLSVSFASWNQLDGWLRQVDGLWRAA